MTLKTQLISLKDFELTEEEKIIKKRLLYRWITLGIIDNLILGVMVYFFIQGNNLYAYSTLALFYIISIITIGWIITSKSYKTSVLIARKNELTEKASPEYIEMLNQMSIESNEDTQSSLLQDIFSKWPSLSSYTSRFWNHRDILAVKKSDVFTYFFMRK